MLDCVSATVPNGLTLAVALEALVCAAERNSALRGALVLEESARLTLLDDFVRDKQVWREQRDAFKRDLEAAHLRCADLARGRDEFQVKLFGSNDENDRLLALSNALRAEVAALKREKAKRARAERSERAKRVALKRKGLVHVNGIG